MSEQEKNFFDLSVRRVRRSCFLVLVKGDKSLVFEEFERVLVAVSDVAAYHKRGRHHAPKSEVHIILFLIAAAEADVALVVHTADKHIRVVIAAGRGLTEHGNLAERDVAERVRTVNDVACRSVHMRAGGAYPLPYVVAAPVAGGEKNLSAGGFECHAHSIIKQRSVGRLGLVAEVVFKEVDAEIRKGLRIEIFVIKA